MSDRYRAFDNLVSIPIGFSSSLQLPSQRSHDEPLHCFNPYRVFKFVATVRKDIIDTNRKLFQSLSGFQVRCNDSGRGVSHCQGLVSIPIGFSSSLQHWNCSRHSPPQNQFQSLSGFQVRCNDVPAEARGYVVLRFQSLSGFQVRCNLKWLFLLTITGNSFQSLSGFQVRCNSLRLQDRRIHFRVSIPIGFSSSLQLISPGSFVDLELGFNPYRVFKFVATSSCSMIVRELVKFQSLSGFQVRCNL